MSAGKPTTEIARLLEIMKTLRSPGGCPWDFRQTPESLKPFLVEETYEVLEAIDSGNPTDICDELGDLLLQIVFQARIFEERGAFAMSDVAKSVADKLVRRHPHVFGELNLSDPLDLDREWERIKSQEKSLRGKRHGTLGGIPRHLPALQRAQKLTEKASRTGFEWFQGEEAFEHLRKELDQLEEAHGQGNRPETEKKFGNLLFSLTNLARYLELDAEEALRGAMNHFAARFEQNEQQLVETGQNPRETNRLELPPPERGKAKARP